MPRVRVISRTCLLLLAIGRVLGAAPLRADDSPELERPDLPTLIANAEGISPDGRPNNYGIGEPARYYVWHDNQGWHVRSTAPKGRLIGFRGAVRLHNAKFLAVRQIGFDKRSDFGGVNEARTEARFKFLTANKFDGFDFNVEGSDDAKIEFELFVNGRKHADRIFIGGKAENPKAFQFAVVADPK